VLATWDGSEEFKFDFPLDLVLAQVSCAELDLVPAEASALWPLDLALVDWSPLTERDIAVDDEEAQAGFCELTDRREHDDLAVGRGGLLLCRDDDTTSLSGVAFRVIQVLGQDLIASCNDLMQRELKAADVVMLSHVLRLLCIVIAVIHLNLESIVPLKVKLDEHFADELRIEVVMNNLSFANLCPPLAILLVDNTEGV